MKRFLLLTPLFFRLISFAQSYPEPDFVEKPMYYDTKENKLHAIERQIKPYKEQIMGYNQTFYYREPRSFSRFKKEEGVQFLIKLVNTIEPDLFLFLYPLTSTDDSRIIKIHLSPSNPNQGFLPFHYRKVAENLYLLTFDTLQEGEYIWYLKSASYLFAVE